MVSIAHRGALERLCDGLGGSTVTWAVTGSVALALQGVRVGCRDLDLVTNTRGAYEVERLFRGNVVEPVGLATRGDIRGHLGRLHVREVDVEVWGDIQNVTSDGGWTLPPQLGLHTVWVDLGQRRCPVLQLDYLRDAYEAMGRSEKVRLIDFARSST